MKQFKLKHFRILLSVLIFVFSAHYLKSQDYKMYAYYNTLSYYQNNDDSAKYYRDKAMSFVEKPLLNNRFYWIKSYAEKGNEKGIIELYSYLLRKGYAYEDVFGSNRKINIRDELKDKLKSMKEVPDIDYNFIIDFSEYIGAEQFVRKRLFRDKECMEKYLFEIDSLNHARLKEYIEENGYPGESRLGKYHYVPQLLIMHIITNKSTKENWYGYYRPILIEQAEVGEVSYSFIAGLDDRFHECYDAYQLYGMMYMAEEPTYRMTNEERQKAPKNLTCPIKDIENLDKRRAEMGMPPFYIMARSRNVKLPKNYNPKK
jgi:hypothetical protein